MLTFSGAVDYYFLTLIDNVNYNGLYSLSFNRNNFLTTAFIENLNNLSLNYGHRLSKFIINDNRATYNNWNNQYNLGFYEH